MSSSKAYVKGVKRTPNKSRTTPSKTRSPRSSRTLPISPISRTTRQSTIKEFFKASPPSNRSQLKTPKEPNIGLSPVFGSLKRNSIKFDSNLSKKLKTNSSEVNENQNITNDMLDSTQSNQTLYLTAYESPQETEALISQQICDQFSIELTINENSDKSLNESMDCMKTDANETNLSQIESNECPAMETNDNINDSIDGNDGNSSPLTAIDFHSECDQKLAQNLLNNDSDDQMEVPLFKVPKAVPKRMVGFNKYMDREKGKQFNYLVNNLKRISRDKQMLEIQPFSESNDLRETSESLIVSEQSDNIWCYFPKPIIGIDIFGEYLPNNIDECIAEETNSKVLSKNLQQLCDLPLSRFSTVIPIYMSRLEEIERQFLICHVIKLVSTEKNIFTFNKIERKTIKILCGNGFEIYLTDVLRHFYQILNNICLKWREICSHLHHFDDKVGEKHLEATSLSICNVFKILTTVLSRCSFKLEAISIEKEFIKLLLISIAFTLEKRMIDNFNWSYTMQQFIEVVIKNIILNELNLSLIIKGLLSLVICNKSLNIGLSLRIASMIPLNADFSLKRKFCISALKMFSSQDILDETYDYGLSDIQSTLDLISWRKLRPQQIYELIQLISLSLDLPNDQMEYKDVITDILNELTFALNRSVPNASNFEYSDIHKLLMVLRSKILVSV